MVAGGSRWLAALGAGAACACTVNLGADGSASAPDPVVALPVASSAPTGATGGDPSGSTDTSSPTSDPALDTGVGPDPAALGGAGSVELDGVVESAIGCTYTADGVLRYRLWFAPNVFLDVIVAGDALEAGTWPVSRVWLVDGAEGWSFQPGEGNGEGALDLDIASVDGAFAVDGASSGQVRVEDTYRDLRTVTAVRLVGCTPEW